MTNPTDRPIAIGKFYGFCCWRDIDIALLPSDIVYVQSMRDDGLRVAVFDTREEALEYYRDPNDPWPEDFK